MLRKAVAIWGVIILTESVLGTLRTLFLVPEVGRMLSSQIGVLVGSIAFLAIAWLSIRWIGARTVRQLAAVGIIWVLLTLAFELGAGHYAFGRSWEYLASDYDLAAGGLLGLGVLVLGFAPWLAAKVRGFVN
jgi:hypothetical protein